MLWQHVPGGPEAAPSLHPSPHVVGVGAPPRSVTGIGTPSRPVSKPGAPPLEDLVASQGHTLVHYLPNKFRGHSILESLAGRSQGVPAQIASHLASQGTDEAPPSL